MSTLTLIRTAPADPPGSMSAYADLVLRALAAYGPTDLVVRTCDLFDPRGGGGMWRHHGWRLCHARRALAAAPADLYHLLDGSMAGWIPRSLLPRLLVTVHDLVPLLQLCGELPGRPSPPAAWLIRRSVRALRNCGGVCAISEQTRADVKRRVGPSWNPVVIPIAVRPLTNSAPLPAPALPGRFILHVGNNADYKNRSGVLDCFAALQAFADLHLILAGPRPSPALRAQAAGLPRVRFTGPVTDGQLLTLYQQAALLLFPSRYEGFGMPVLEAMAAGCPVVCSTGGALGEVAGGAALTAPAGAVDRLAAHCRSLLTDAGLRAKMVARGRRQAARFTLPAMGNALLDWYQAARRRRPCTCS